MMIALGKCTRGPWPGVALLLAAALLTVRVEAQLITIPVVISNARVITMGGRELEKATIIIKGDRISELGRNLKVPFLARRIDAEGRTITPGFIDVYSALGMTSGRSRTASPTSRAEDAVDRYATEHLGEALRGGVTAAYVSSRGGVGVHGTGAVIRLVPGQDGSLGEVLAGEKVLEIDLGSAQRPLARIATFDAVRKQFRDALDYRRTREIYEEDLKEYEEKLKERAEKKKKDDKDDKDDKDKKPEAKKSADKDGKDKGGKEKGADKPPTRRGGATGAPSTTSKSPAGEKSPEKDELKKPTEPRRDPAKEVLLRALDRELRVRIEAHRSADILNALDLQTEFALDVILEGATEAHLVADAIAKVEVPVVLGSQLEPEVRQEGPFRGRLESGAVLSRAGVDWWVGSGARAGAAARFAFLNAQIAAAASRVDDPGGHALALVTSRAAELLDVAGQIGRIAPNLKADLVIWSSDPRDPAAKVEKVFIDGKLAYDAKAAP